MSTTTTSFAIWMASFGLNPVDDIVHERVDLMEVNHFYDEQGAHVFDQIIFYDWSPSDSRYNVRAWRLIKSPSQLPQRSWKQRDFVAVWHDAGVLREVRAVSKRESWTQHDPELSEREFLPKDQRAGLRKLGSPSTTD